MDRKNEVGARAYAFGPDGRDALELLARMLVPGGYRVPVEGRSTLPSLGAADIAGAIACMRDPLQKHVAVAVATRGGRRAGVKTVALAYRQVSFAIREAVPRPLDLDEPADRWRLRIVIYDAARELIDPDARQPWSVLAKAARMRKSAYVQTHRIATAVLQEALTAARRDFRIRMFSS